MPQETLLFTFVLSITRYTCVIWAMRTRKCRWGTRLAEGEHSIGLGPLLTAGTVPHPERFSVVSMACPGMRLFLFVAPAWFWISQGASGWRRVCGLICSCSQEVFADLLPKLLLIYCSVIFPLVPTSQQAPAPSWKGAVCLGGED